MKPLANAVFFCGAVSFGVLADTGLGGAVAPMIVNGNHAEVSNYPYFASLYFDRTDDSTRRYGNMCGATILDEQHVLTAAHCVEDGYARAFTTVAVGVQYEDNFKEKEAVRAAQFFVHPSYDSNIDNGLPNDIAIIKLERPLATYDVSQKVELVRDATPGQEPYRNVNAELLIIGHGNTLAGVDSAEQLEKAVVTYTDACHQASQGGATQSQICFDSPLENDRYRAACSGDSGGPLLWRTQGGYKQIGVASMSLVDCGATSAEIKGAMRNIDWASIYTEVSDYTAWIDSVTLGGEEPTFEVNEAVRVAIRVQEASTGGGGSLGWFGLLILSGLSLFRRR